MAEPFVSFVVVCLNEEHRLPKLLKDIDEQGCASEESEVILVDNGSKDKTLLIMKEYYDNHKRVQVLRHEGVQSACYQLSLEKASGRWMVFLGADMGLPQDWLIRIKGLIATHTDCDAFVARLLPLFRRTGPYNDYVRAYWYGATSKDGKWEDATFHSGGLAVRRKVALKVGFDKSLPVAEDGDFSFRFLRSGFQAYYSTTNAVYDEQYYDMPGLLSYYKKLGLASVVLFKKTHSSKVAYGFLIRTLLEPITPHYIHLRFQKGRKFSRIGRGSWMLSGMARTYSILYSLILYGLINLRPPTKIQRRKG